MRLFSVLAIIVVVASCSDKPSIEDNIRTIPVERITVTGILVDTWCYGKTLAEQTSFQTPIHVDEECALKSIEQGYPVALVIDSTTTWVLSENPRVFSSVVNDSVRVTGDVRSAGVLIPREAHIKQEGKWELVY